MISSLKKLLQKNNLRLVYFDFPFWRVDICRLTLEIANIKYKNVVISKKYFLKNKKTQEFPFGQLPILTVNNTIISQTSAMIRYCGKLANLYPNDPMECALVDQVIDFANDITYLISPSIREKNQKIKNLKRKKLNDIILPEWINYLERFFINNNLNSYFVTEKFTVSDLIVWRILLWLTSGKLENVDLKIEQRFPRLNKYFKFISNNSTVINLKEYSKIMKNQINL